MAPPFRETPPPPPVVRPLRDDDALDVIELIAGVFGEYPGCVTDVDGEMPELRRLASHYAEHGGEGWVAVRGDRVVGTVGIVVSGDAIAELKKLYVHRTERGTGLAGALVELAEASARARGARAIELWSDTRFERAHRFYERRGYARPGATRELHDLSHTVEYYFGKELG